MNKKNHFVYMRRECTLSMATFNQSDGVLDTRANQMKPQLCPATLTKLISIRLCWLREERKAMKVWSMKTLWWRETALLLYGLVWDSGETTWYKPRYFVKHAEQLLQLLEENTTNLHAGLVSAVVPPDYRVASLYRSRLFYSSSAVHHKTDFVLAHRDFLLRFGCATLVHSFPELKWFYASCPPYAAEMNTSLLGRQVDIRLWAFSRTEKRNATPVNHYIQLASIFNFSISLSAYQGQYYCVKHNC